MFLFSYRPSTPRGLAELHGVDSAKDVVERAFEGTPALTFQPALRSLSPAATVARYAKVYPRVESFEQVRELSPQDRDAMLPTKFGYTALSAGQGVATALAVTGAEVAATVTAGTTAVVAVGALSETYGIDPKEWMNEAPALPAGEISGDKPVVDVVEVLDSQRSDEDGELREQG